MLLDPYARAVYFPPNFSRRVAAKPGSNVGRAPLGMLEACTLTSEQAQKKNGRRQSGHVIYEMHVHGFTQGEESGVAEQNRGTYVGVVEKIPYLEQLGITAVELMPVFQFDPQEKDYWGYMPLNFFSPHQGYSCTPTACSPREQFRDMVAAVHASGIEVILDVVYNHTLRGTRLARATASKALTIARITC